MLEGENWGGLPPFLALQGDAKDTLFHSPQLPHLPALAQRDISRVWGLLATCSGCSSCGTFHLHKPTLKAVPSSPSFSCLNLQRCYLKQEATSHPVCLKETLHNRRVSKIQPQKISYRFLNAPENDCCSLGKSRPPLARRREGKLHLPAACRAPVEGQSSLSR